MEIVAILLIPITLVWLLFFFMTVICRPVRRKGDVIIIGYFIFCKKYNPSDSVFIIEVEESGGFRSHSWNVVIHVYQKDTRKIIREHILRGHWFEKGALKEREKTQQIVFKEN